uniref:Uncharacterized protein n=1 Tax=Chaetoceros debilis TaxID=122233 RepID=A0A7S3Q019_9STRA
MSSMNANARAYVPQQTNVPSFHQFLELQDEIVVSILAFVADCPFERHTLQNKSTLTHVLPLVSKQFYAISRNSDYIWKGIMTRLLKNESNLWEAALESFLDTNPSPPNVDSSKHDNDPGCILTKARTSIRNIIATEKIQNPYYGEHGEMFTILLNEHIRYSSPLFYMPDDSIQINSAFGLHFFEPRYRRLIREVMAPYPERFRNGIECSEENGLPSPPTFIYANRSPLRRGSLACIVKVLQCDIHENGTADVMMMPIETVRVELVWEQVDVGDHLYFAKAIRVTEKEQREIELDHMRSYYPNLSAQGASAQTYVTNMLRALAQDRAGSLDDHESDEDERGS